MVLNESSQVSRLHLYVYIRCYQSRLFITAWIARNGKAIRLSSRRELKEPTSRNPLLLF